MNDFTIKNEPNIDNDERIDDWMTLESRSVSSFESPESFDERLMHNMYQSNTEVKPAKRSKYEAKVNKKRSEAWNYFIRVEEGAKCLHCHRTVACKNNTTNLFQHLKGAHREIYYKLKSNALNTTNDTTISNISCMDDENILPDTPDATTVDTQHFNNTTLNRNVVTARLSMQRPENEHITDAIAKYMATSNMPYSLVEDENFRQLIKAIAPNYQMPIRLSFSENRIPQIYKQLHEQINIAIQQTPYISLTIDAWSDANQRHLLNVTCALITTDWEIKSYALACRQADMPATKENIQTLLEDVLQDFAIEKSKIVGITSESNVNIKQAISEMHLKYTPCIAHAIQQLVSAIYKIDIIETILKKLQNIHNIFAYSEKATRKLTDIQRDLLLKMECMPGYSHKSNWCSKLNQINFVLTQQDALKEFLNHFSDGQYATYRLDEHELSILQSLVPLLDKLKKFNNTLSVDTDVTGTAILKSVQEIESLLQNFTIINNESAETSLKIHMIKLANEFTNNYKDNVTHLDKAAYLDPRFEKTEYSSGIVESALRLEVRQDNIMTDYIMPKKKSTLAGLFSDELQQSIDDHIGHELKRFKWEPRLAYSYDVLNWWKLHEKVYPVLSQLARKYLTISATCFKAQNCTSCSGGGEAMSTKFRLPMAEMHSERKVLIAKNQKLLTMLHKENL